jgi:hypothetical protein
MLWLGPGLNPLPYGKWLLDNLARRGQERRSGIVAEVVVRPGRTVGEFTVGRGGESVVLADHVREQPAQVPSRARSRDIELLGIDLVDNGPGDLESLTVPDADIGHGLFPIAIEGNSLARPCSVRGTSQPPRWAPERQAASPALPEEAHVRPDVEHRAGLDHINP